MKKMIASTFMVMLLIAVVAIVIGGLYTSVMTVIRNPGDRLPMLLIISLVGNLLFIINWAMNTLCEDVEDVEDVEEKEDKE